MFLYYIFITSIQCTIFVYGRIKIFEFEFILGGTLGGGWRDPHGYVGWGCHWTSKCMELIESLLRVFTPYFYWCVCHIKAQRHTLNTNYLFSYFAGSTYGITLFLIWIDAYAIYPARSNDYYLASERVYWGLLGVNGHFWGGQREKNRQKEGHSGGTYIYYTNIDWLAME